MSKMILTLILVFVAINAAFLFIYLNKPSENITDTDLVSNKTQKPSQEVSNQTSQNESLNLSLIYESNCINSTKKHVEGIENITNVTVLETRIFDKEADVTYYLSHNWSSVFYNTEGMKKDITEKTLLAF